MSYAKDCENMVNAIATRYPEIDRLIKRIREIDQMSLLDFDYMIEKTELKYRAAMQILHPEIDLKSLTTPND